MKKQLLTSFLVLLIGIPASAALAAGPEHKGKYDKFILHFDTDKDGVVTQAEFAHSSAQRFNAIDTDGNRTISAEEFSRYIQGRRQQRQQSAFKQMDSNGDGHISHDEYLEAKRQRAERGFQKMDKNGDGQVDEQEFAGSGNGHKTRGGNRIFSKLDANGDGQITPQESEAAWLNWFKRLDINGDSVVTVEEVQQAHSNRKDR